MPQLSRLRRVMKGMGGGARAVSEISLRPRKSGVPRPHGCPRPKSGKRSSSLQTSDHHCCTLSTPMLISSPLLICAYLDFARCQSLCYCFPTTGNCSPGIRRICVHVQPSFILCRKLPPKPLSFPNLFLCLNEAWNSSKHRAMSMVPMGPRFASYEPPKLKKKNKNNSARSV